MMSLFSSFDLKINLFCLMTVFSLLLLLKLNLFMSTFESFYYNYVMSYLNSFFQSLKNLGVSKMTPLILTSFFFILLVLNISSVFMFIFPVSSQINSMFFMAFSSWLSFILFFFFKMIKGFLSHSVPEGTPMALITLLFLIEIISNLIRPFTITVRLVSNILAGHLLMLLLSKVVFYSPFFTVFYIGLNLVELLVAVIQAYIFTTMMMLYYSDVN